MRANHPHPRRSRAGDPHALDPHSSSRLTESGDLEVELGAAPVAALGVVPGGSGGRNADGQQRSTAKGGWGTLKKSSIFPIGTGGTYAKVNNFTNIINLIKDISSRDFDPLIYFHPYEFKCGNNFLLTFKDLKNCKKLKNNLSKLFFLIRQFQWITPFNKNLIDKMLTKLKQNSYVAGGTLSSLYYSRMSK